jgi:four helix bundle protein
MKYEDWLKSVPPEIREDSLWKMEACRLALFAADLAWHDATKLLRDKRTSGLSGQRYEAIGSISANTSKGYSRGTGRDRARFYEYALGSARESRGWYYQGRHVSGEAATNHRIRFLTQIIRLLLTIVPDQRGDVLREDSVNYSSDPRPEAPELLQRVPMP